MELEILLTIMERKISRAYLHRSHLPLAIRSRYDPISQSSRPPLTKQKKRRPRHLQAARKAIGSTSYRAPSRQGQSGLRRLSTAAIHLGRARSSSLCPGFARRDEVDVSADLNLLDECARVGAMPASDDVPLTRRRAA